MTSLPDCFMAFSSAELTDSRQSARRKKARGAGVRFADSPNEKCLAFTLEGEGVPDETCKFACVVMNGDNSVFADFSLPAGSWSIAGDEKGAVPQIGTFRNKSACPQSRASSFSNVSRRRGKSCVRDRGWPRRISDA